MKKVLLLLLLLIFLSSCTTNIIDEHATYNFTYITSIYDIHLGYTNLNSSFAKGDAILIESRINGQEPTKAIPHYKQALKETENKEEQAILLETIASITGNKKYYKQSYKLWEELNNTFRSQIDYNLYKGNEITFSFKEYIIKDSYIAPPKDATTLSIGESYFFIEPDDILVSQVDRVNRDWLSSQLQEPSSSNILTIFSEGYDVEGIGWHEGGRITQYKQITNFTHKPVTGTIVAKINNTWYAPNEKGVFMFEVPNDKVQYPTTRYLSEDIALIIDTHGVNMLVEQAIKEKATVVVGCCDHPGKVKASLYLNEKGINVICNTDKFLPLALGKTDSTLGSPPFFDNGNKVRIGYQPITINLSEKIIVLNATNYYGLTYYNTPTLYFSELKRKTTLPLDLEYVYIDGYAQLDKLINKARETNAQVIAARVYNENDYLVLKEWVEEDKKNRLILFHSQSYPFGHKLYKEYSQQITFDDISPKFT
jgi:hypothetical protein